MSEGSWDLIKSPLQLIRSGRLLREGIHRTTSAPEFALAYALPRLLRNGPCDFSTSLAMSHFSFKVPPDLPSSQSPLSPPLGLPSIPRLLHSFVATTQAFCSPNPRSDPESLPVPKAHTSASCGSSISAITRGFTPSRPPLFSACLSAAWAHSCPQGPQNSQTQLKENSGVPPSLKAF